MDIKKEDEVSLFQNFNTETSSLLNNSKRLEIEHFNLLNAAVEVKAEINDTIYSNIETPEGCILTIKNENIEPVSNNNYQFKTHSHAFRPHHYIHSACPICRKSFSSSSKRKKHFMSHFYLPSNIKRKKNYFGRCLFICMFCGKVCIRKDEISMHCLIYKTKILSASNSFQPNSICCSGRKETISQFITLKNEIDIDIKNEIDIDYDNFSIKQELEEIVPVQPLKCEVCLREFKSKTSLKKHLSRHPINQTCPICLKMCSSSYMLKRHLISHSSLKLFKCKFCLKHYKTNQSLKYHMSLNCERKSSKLQKTYCSETALHNNSCNSGSFDCNACRKYVGYKSRLDAHMPTHTQERRYKCEMCPKMFKYPQDLKRHVLYHTGEKPFECNVCQKRFRIKQHLTRHMFCHDDEKPFKCDICSKMFTQKSALVYHVRRHTSDTPFKCNVCPKEFTEKKILDYHVLGHTGDKPFQCPTCSKRFKQKQDLKRHSRIHTENKTVTCEICGKYFTRAEHLTNHLRTHTGEKPYQCYVCLGQFSVRQNFIKHLRKHTKEIPK